MEQINKIDWQDNLLIDNSNKIDVIQYFFIFVNLIV